MQSDQIWWKCNKFPYKSLDINSLSTNSIFTHCLSAFLPTFWPNAKKNDVIPAMSTSFRNLCDSNEIFGTLRNNVTSFIYRHTQTTHILKRNHWKCQCSEVPTPQGWSHIKMNLIFFSLQKKWTIIKWQVISYLITAAL